MLSLLSGLGPHFHPRYYVIANTDTMSKQKVEEFEQQKNITENSKPEVEHIANLLLPIENDKL